MLWDCTRSSVVFGASLVLSPVCAVSSRIFRRGLAVLVSELPLAVASLLAAELALSTIFLGLVLRERILRTLFYPEFLLLVGTLMLDSALSSCHAVGTGYALAGRREFLEEVLAKASLVLSLVCLSEPVARAVRTKTEGDCAICCIGLDEVSLVLGCGHAFHEGCLWRWVYERKCCPQCAAPM